MQLSPIIPNNKSPVNNQGMTSLGPDMGAMGGQTDDGSHDFLNRWFYSALAAAGEIQ